MTSLQVKREPKYLQLAEEIRAQVSNGRLKPGDQLPSFVELRTEHQISRGTVEKVHALLEKEGLIVREQGRGVFVAPAAGRERKGVIGFVGGGFAETSSSLYWAHLLEGIQQGAIEHRTQLMLINRLDLENVLDGIDGLLISENEDTATPLLRNLPSGLPCVSIMTPLESVSCVTVDDYQGARDATSYLLALGHKRIAHLVAGHSHLIETRLQGYQDALRGSGIEPHLSWVRQLRLRKVADSKSEYVLAGEKTIEEWLRTDWEQTACTALVAQNDHAAVGAIEALQRAGIRVPQEFSVVGFDGTEMYDYYSPRPTTVEIPLRSIGRKAIDQLMRMVASESVPIENLALRTELKIGASSAPRGQSAVNPSYTHTR